MTTLEYYIGVRNCPLHGFSTPDPSEEHWPCPWCSHEEEHGTPIVIATPSDLGIKLTPDPRGTASDFIAKQGTA